MPASIDRPCVLYVVTEDWYFWSHRLGLAQHVQQAGYDVALSARFGNHRTQIEAAQIRCLPLPFERSLRYPWRDLRCMFALWRLIRVERPALVHLVALKPMLLSAVAIAFVPHVQFVYAVTGLGYLFTAPETTARGLRRISIVLLRWLLSRRNSALIVQNHADAQELRSHAIGDPSRTRLIAGAGVDTTRYAPAPQQEEPTPLVVLPARMLRDKGVYEFITAAAQVLATGVNVRFALVGPLDPDNPAALTQSEIQARLVPGIEWWGARSEMVSVYQRAALVCLPSHREGLPKVLLEAAACGRALIATDVPGCREICRNEVTGLLVAPRDPAALASAILRLLHDSTLRGALGAAARRVVEAEFSIEIIAAQTLNFYADLLPHVTRKSGVT